VLEGTQPRYGSRQRARGDDCAKILRAISELAGASPDAQLDPGKALELAKDVLAQVRLGRDPVAEKMQARAQPPRSSGYGILHDEGLSPALPTRIVLLKIALISRSFAT
jgi:hypothetical protein